MSHLGITSLYIILFSDFLCSKKSWISTIFLLLLYSPFPLMLLWAVCRHRNLPHNAVMMGTPTVSITFCRGSTCQRPCYNRQYRLNLIITTRSLPLFIRSDVAAIPPIQPLALRALLRVCGIIPWGAGGLILTGSTPLQHYPLQAYPFLEQQHYPSVTLPPVSVTPLRITPPRIPTP